VAGYELAIEDEATPDRVRGGWGAAQANVRAGRSAGGGTTSSLSFARGDANEAESSSIFFRL
jgi:hypothetical protein